MRRILADRVVLADQLEIQPVGDQHVLKIAEPNSGNFGPTGFYGVGDRVRSRQAMNAEVEEAGNYRNQYPDEGARFSLLLEFLEDEDDDEICDEYNRMGAEWANIPVYNQSLLAVDNTTPYYSPKMIRLRKWQDRGTNYGVEGMLFAVRQSGTSVQVHTWEMRVYQDHDQLGSGDMCYQWRDNSLQSDLAITATNVPSVDAVELDDGSIVVVISDDDQLHFFKSFDQGSNWTAIANITGLSSDTWSCAIDRIGSRLVVCYGRSNGGGGTTDVFSRVSDDGGYTWSSSGSTIYSAAPATQPNMDLCRGQDGMLYIAFRTNALVYVDESRDGWNWATTSTNTGQVCDANCTIMQEYDGTWHMYSIEDAAGVSPFEVFHVYQETEDNPKVSGWDGKNNFNFGCADSDGCDSSGVCAREFHDSCFIDVAVLYHDTHGVSDYYKIMIHRASMWTGIQMYPTLDLWLRIWTAHAYPSTTDPDPNLNIWTRVQAGAGAAALAFDGEFGELAITAGGVGDNLNYNRALANDSYDTGMMCSFEVKAVTSSSNAGRVKVILCSGPSNKDVEFYVTVSTTGLGLYDVNGASTVDTFTPTNWATTDWNYYVVLAFENQVRVYRAPSGDYREIAHMELVLTYDALQEDAYAADNDEVRWGMYVAAGAAASDWRSFAYGEGCVDIDWDFDEDLRGRKCHFNPVGIMQGFGCKWEGEFARLNDDWDLRTGAHYEADNVFVDSPSIRWQEPIEDSPPSSAQVFEWERGEDINSADMKYNFNAFAVFGRNWLHCKLEGGDAGGGGWSTLFDSDGGTQLAYMILRSVTSIDQNAVTMTMSPYEDMIPEQFASDDYRKYYVRFTTGSLANRTYRILGNNTDTLFLEEDVETAGAGATDSFVIFTDRFFFEFASMQSYERLRLTIASQYASPTEAQLRLGSLVIGRTYDLKDDAWESTITTIPNVKVTAGRSGVQSVDEMGQEKRVVNVKYTGHFDRGMGITDPSQLWRFLRQSVHPMVWIDDDAGLVEDSDNVFHEPILVRRMGSADQSRLCYSVESQVLVATAVDWHRSMWEQSIKLEEVL